MHGYHIKIFVFEEVMRVEGETKTKDMDTRELFQRRKLNSFQEANENTRPTPGKAQPKSYEEQFASTDASTQDDFAIPNKHQVLFVVCLNSTLNKTMLFVVCLN